MPESSTIWVREEFRYPGAALSVLVNHITNPPCHHSRPPSTIIQTVFISSPSSDTRQPTQTYLSNTSRGESKPLRHRTDVMPPDSICILILPRCLSSGTDRALSWIACVARVRKESCGRSGLYLESIYNVDSTWYTCRANHQFGDEVGKTEYWWVSDGTVVGVERHNRYRAVVFWE